MDIQLVTWNLIHFINYFP